MQQYSGVTCVFIQSMHAQNIEKSSILKSAKLTENS